EIAGENADFAELLRYVHELPLERIRYTTSHPREFTQRLIDAHAELGKLAPHVHLPVQSGSDRVLAAMKRGYTSLEYRSIVRRLRAARPGISVSSDFIVGFPGETDADFEQTMDLVRRVNYASAFSFMYSPRPGTPAATMAGQVPDAVSRERLHVLQALLTEQQVAFNEAQAGRTLPVLFERKGRHGAQAIGRSPYLQSVHVDDADHLIGRIVPVTIEHGQQNSLTGRLMNENATPPKQRDAARRATGAAQSGA
ncbi:MiaB/RimO family radical SAM methylthiotransferase, partial [Brevundimonas sp.]|uniref:MiaB/RimO family radical SAM methylthiotransferase n=1 Tax=Brevundimonas sp. TaxID=1871086 RepID=UPI002D697020